MKFRTRLAVIRYILLKLRRKDLIITGAAAIALIINVVGLVAGGGGPLFWLAVIALLIDVAGQLKDFAELTEPSADGMQLIRSVHLPSAGDALEVPLKSIVPDASDCEIGYAVHEVLPDEPVALSDQIDRWLLSQPTVSLIIASGYEGRVLGNLRSHWHDFEDILALEAQEATRNGRHFYNEAKLALVGGLAPGATSVRAGATSYFSSVVTNEASMKVIKRQNRIVKDLRVLYPYRPGDEPSLQPLEGSIMSDHIGVSLLVRTSDGFVVEWMQGTKNQQNRGRVVPTASGSLDWNDYRRSRAKDLLSVVRYGMAREFMEEGSRKRLAWDLPSAELLDKIYIVGFFRWLQRGGKPEFVGLAQLPVSLHDLKPNWEADMTDLVTGEVIAQRRIYTLRQLAAYCAPQPHPDARLASIPLAVLRWRIKAILQGQLGDEARATLARAWNISE